MNTKLVRELLQVSKKEGEELTFDQVTKEVRIIYKKYGFSTKEINKKIKDREDNYMNSKFLNEIAISDGNKNIISFTPEELSFFIDMVNVLVSLETISINSDKNIGSNYLIEKEKTLKGYTKGFIRDMLRDYIFDNHRDKKTRYNKRLSAEISYKVDLLSNSEFAYVVGKIIDNKDMLKTFKLM